jgi:1,4-dihydroxy-2-naphthoate octaprenyltransferase
MTNQEPSILQILRAPFFSSILAPLLAGSFLAGGLMGSFNLLGFLLVLVMGLGLHAATNVYNDIYDTKQGTDKINRHRNEFSGGSGIIIQYPQLLPKMYNIARMGLIIALLATIGLMFVVDKRLWGYLWGLYLISAFFSKYYTAAPPKLSYRGIGEVSVWFAFGPMAIMVASVSQNLGLHDTIILAMPPTGISTLSILLIGELIDYPADKEAGKWGVAVRLGTQATAFLYIIVQSILVLNILTLSLMLGKSGLVILLCIIPYLFLLPSIIKVVVTNHDNPAALQPAAKQNVKLHLLFSICLVIGFLIFLIM